ncbi:hypothetical protein ACFYKX_01395 [Cytobacillus sp. FJAT-54145]|uniref:Alpha/beta hydrolase n=1 Tax=Cytobacillus spartinae TaxID=3299023 RepID=A0ABW6K518_9BACI
MIRKTFMAITLGAALVISSTSVGAKSTEKAPSKNSQIAYYVDESTLPFDALDGYKTDRYWGVHNGAGYRIEVPKDWNGELVLYAHGYRGTGLELTVSNPSIREHLLEKGYAWAASSYSTNGYDVAQAVKDTHALGSYFNGKVKKPKKTYVMGHSMGGHITAVLSEQYVSAYDGALPMCGVTGDTELFDFFTDYGLVAQALSGVKKENQKILNDEEYKLKILPQVYSSLGIGQKLTVAGENFKTVIMNLTGGERPLFDVAFNSYKDFLFQQMPVDPTYLVASGNVIDNTDSVYQLDNDLNLSPDERLLNNAVLRITSDPNTKQKGLTGVPKVEGKHKIPMISLHNVGDLFVPFHMQQIHAKRAQENSNEDLLVTRAIRAVGHCDFTPEEEVQAFEDLVQWVEKGVKPEGDDILNPSAVADPSFGKKFTKPLRNFDLLNNQEKSEDSSS